MEGATKKRDIFEPIALSILLRNRTSGSETWFHTPIPTPRTEQKHDEHSIHVVEVGPDFLVLDVPPKACNVGHSLELKIKTSGMDDEISLEVVGEVTEFEPIDDQAHIRVEFRIYDQLEWKIVRVNYFEAQNQIENLFLRMKGQG